MTGSARLLLFFVVFSLALDGIRGDGEVDVDGEELEAPLRSELEQLRSKIPALESKIDEVNLQLETKEETLLQFENVIKEKAEIIASLHAEIESLQKKGAIDASEAERKAHARTTELEKQFDKLKNDIQAQVQKRDALEARAVEAEKKVQELHSIFKSLQKTDDDQKSRIKKTQLALEKAEEELMKVLLEASSKKKELTEIHGAWLPPWLATHLGHCQATAAAHWNEHGKPSYDAFAQKVSEVLAQAQKKFEPHLETAKEKWIPTLKQHWVTARTSAEPHVGKVQTILKPYTEQVVYASENFLKSATTYHHQVQSAVKGMLEKHELTKALATEEIVWFAASACLVPIFLTYRWFSSTLSQKPRSTQKRCKSCFS